MSLKHFHLFFIALSVLTAFGFGAWSLLTRGLPASFFWMGWISLIGGVALLIYGVRFYRKSKKVIV